MRSRTQIPRTDRTLATLPSLAIFPDAEGSQPIAWSLLGPDASLSSLHVEPEYRGRGLAKVLARKLFREGMEMYWRDSWDAVDGEGKGEESGMEKDRWAHADVAVDNVPSNAVCTGLGGQWGFMVYWIRVDVGAASHGAQV